MASLLSSTARRTVGQLSPSTTAFLCCDVQERFRSVIHNGEAIVKTAGFLNRVGHHLDVPVFVTEQYPKGLGKTCAEALSDGVDADGKAKVLTFPTFEKTLFSMVTPQFSAHALTPPERFKAFVLYGIEAHVCVLQTCLDLLSLGYEVHVVSDCVSSQSPEDRRTAIRRMEMSGAYTTSSQSVLFMLMGSAGHPKFKEMSKLAVEHGAFERTVDWGRSSL